MFQDLARALHISRVTFDLLAAAVLVVVALAAGFALSRLLRHYAKRLARTWGEVVFSLLEPLPVPLLLLAALYAALENLTLPARWEHLGTRLILTLTLVVLFYFPAKVVLLFLRRASQRRPELERVTQPATFVVRILFALVATIVVLENLGVHLTALWTTLGIGSVAVALALQDTLGNLFAGLYLLADRPISPGDYVKLDSGQEGYVVRIGWRSTQFRTLPNNLVIVPNSTLSKAVITNYSVPIPQLSVQIPVSVAYGTDSRRVEKVLTEVAQQAASDGVEGLLASPAPFVRFIPGFGASSLDFTLIVRVREFTDQYLVQHELRHRIVERFAKEGIVIPYPYRTLTLDDSAAAVLREALKKSGD